MGGPDIGGSIMGIARWLGLATRRDLEAVRTDLEARMSETEDRLWERAGARAVAIMAELESLRESDTTKSEALAAAQAFIAGEGARTQETVAAAVSEALALDTAKDIERLRGHLGALGDDIPVDLPEQPETPAAGEPAVIPETESGETVPVVDESALPTTDDAGNVTEGTAPGDEVAPVIEPPQS